MPFDGIEFLPQQPLSSAFDPAATAQAWYIRWAARLRLKLSELLSPPPYSPETAANVVQLLADAQASIASPETWTKFVYETSSGRRCAVGALYRAAAQQRRRDLALVWEAHQALLRVALHCGFPTVESMNDHSSHARVLILFDEAITATRQHAAGRA